MPGVRECVEQNVFADLLIVQRHAMGLPQAVREMTKPRAAIVLVVRRRGGWAVAGDTLSPHGPHVGGRGFSTQAEVITSRLRDVARVAPFAVAITSPKVVCNGMPTSKRFGGGARACRFGCRAVGGDDARHYLLWPCSGRRLPPSVGIMLPAVDRWRGHAFASVLSPDGGTDDGRSCMLCGTKLYVGRWSASHRWSYAAPDVAHTVLINEVRGLLTRAPAQRGCSVLG